VFNVLLDFTISLMVVHHVQHVNLELIQQSQQIALFVLQAITQIKPIPLNATIALITHILLPVARHRVQAALVYCLIQGREVISAHYPPSPVHLVFM
jgi:hypothetical protein